MESHTEKLFLLIVFILTIFIACTSDENKSIPTIIETSYVYIEIDTVYLETELDLYSSFKYENKIYVYFYQKGFCKIAVFNNNGQFDKVIEFPKEIDKDWRLDYIAIDKGLFVIEERKNTTIHLLNKKGNRLQLSDIDEMPIYDDDKYSVYRTYHGEWGGMVYFKNKNTNRIYRGYSNKVINVTKFQDSYYVTSYLGHMMGHSQIVKIDEPTKMQEYNGFISDLINNRAESSEEERYVFDGIKILLDTFELRSVGSFIHKNRLLQLWNEYPSSNKLYFTEQIEEKSICRHIFETPMKVKYLYNSKNNNESHILNFEIETEEQNEFGFIEINNEKVKIIFLKKMKLLSNSSTN
ncbi:hypothetical protein IR083_20505 [Dysgonomonas sp. GY75]|uniref:hypothetical protein n=1 Tax=Dysgonomonas sp. GY75 TaxID=2780419 RepID=UPI001883192C|nr:hypothetical protein [Dysgonomonas sp. GY75]MBF0651204.1 hypothetical protein [Dysgonomonas sp. GY75]